MNHLEPININNIAIGLNSKYGHQEPKTMRTPQVLSVVRGVGSSDMIKRQGLKYNYETILNRKNFKFSHAENHQSKEDIHVKALHSSNLFSDNDIYNSLPQTARQTRTDGNFQ